MMKKILIMSLALLTMASCEDLTELNKDLKRPEEVPAASLFANATMRMFDFMTNQNVNINNFRLWAQYWAQTTYADESNYILVERNVNGNTWNEIYTNVIRDMEDAKMFIDEDGNLTDAQKTTQKAMAEVVQVLAYHVLVDIFGDIPYTEALGDDVTPAYDDDAAIYSALETRLDAAIANLSGDSRLGSYDLVYGGNADMWRLFANSLKLRMAIRTGSQSRAEAAVADGVFASSADNFSLTYSSSTPNTNPLWVTLIQSGRSDYIAASSIIDPLNALKDPRISRYFSDQTSIIYPTDANGVIIDYTFNTPGLFVTYNDVSGLIDSTVWVSGDVTISAADAGRNPRVFAGGAYGDNNNYNAFSHPGELQEDPTWAGVIMSYSEVAFLMADGASRGWNMGGTAETFYNAGIEASILYWGGDANEVSAYLAQPDVAYATAPGTEKQRIAMQKWIALYDQGFEAWSTIRLYDYPVLPIAVQAQIPTPSRYTYPVSEYSLNETNVEDAGARMGQDALGSKIFWDN